MTGTTHLIGRLCWQGGDEHVLQVEGETSPGVRIQAWNVLTMGELQALHQILRTQAQAARGTVAIADLARSPVGTATTVRLRVTLPVAAGARLLAVVEMYLDAFRCGQAPRCVWPAQEN